MNPEERIIVALDLEMEDEFKRVLKEISSFAKIVKLGPVPLFGIGFKTIEMVREEGLDIFLDLKHMDIPNTVALSAKGIAKIGVKMFTLHCLGGKEMIKSTRNELSSFQSPPLIIGVTVLTSWDADTLSSFGIPSMDGFFESLVKIGIEGGVDGFVCSPKEARMVKNLSQNKICITPGIRLTQEKDDQKRTGSPEEAIESGADYIVVGRPIIKSPEPARAFMKILERIKLCKQSSV